MEIPLLQKLGRQQRLQRWVNLTLFFRSDGKRIPFFLRCRYRIPFLFKTLRIVRLFIVSTAPTFVCTSLLVNPFPSSVSLFTSRRMRLWRASSTFRGRPLFSLRLSMNTSPRGFRACLYTDDLDKLGNKLSSFLPRIPCTWYNTLISAEVFGCTLWWGILLLIC